MRKKRDKNKKVTNVFTSMLYTNGTVLLMKLHDIFMI